LYGSKKEYTQDTIMASHETTVAEVGRFVVGRTMGEGTFGVVKLATHTITREKVALKILSKTKMDELKIRREMVQREIDSLRLCRAHPHLIWLYDVYDYNDALCGDVILVEEYASGGDLYDYVTNNQRLAPDEARRFFQQIIVGVEYIHHKRIVHRDLTLDNILLDGNHKNIKIADFGFAHYFCNNNDNFGGQQQLLLLKTQCASPNYAAPELLSGEPYSGTEVDVWSCGVVLYGMLCGALPFDEPSVPNLFQKIRAGEFSLPTHLSWNARTLISRMLTVDPKKRITIAEIRLQPFFSHHLPSYLNQSPEEMEMKQKCNHEDTEVIINDILRLYSASDSSQAKQVTRELIERALVITTEHNDDPGDDIETSELIRDLRLHYQLILNHKEDASHDRAINRKSILSWAYETLSRHFHSFDS
jgi:5'-AMP-activated protein kinase catalytic alpha subunit